MARTFSSLEVITLPVLDSSGARALGRELLAAAQSKGKLPTPLARAKKDLNAAYDALQAAAAERLAASPGDPTAQREADTMLDSAWAALQSLLSAWSRLPTTTMPEKPAKAKALLELLYPTGLRFVNLPYKDQWAESETRLRVIARPEVAADLHKLGAAPFVATLEQAHASYGKVLGVTVPSAEANRGPSIRDSLKSFSESLRRYVLLVAAFAETEEGEALELADAMLAPLATWASRRRAAKVNGDEAGNGEESTEEAPPAATPSASP
jgi:hypothetical protein